MLNDLHTVISAVAGESYSLMGYSMGARLALLYALEYSSEIENLILESGSAGIESEVERQARKDADEQLALAIEDNDGAWLLLNGLTFLFLKVNISFHQLYKISCFNVGPIIVLMH